MIDEKKVDEAAQRIARNTWDSWISDLEDKDQPTCDIDNPEDCENCGS